MLKLDRICQPKVQGGLGLRRAANMNKAMLAKTYWRLLTEPDNLWSKVIRGKYDVWKPLHLCTNTLARSSNIWRSLTWSSDVLNLGIKWKIGNGESINF